MMARRQTACARPFPKLGSRAGLRPSQTYMTTGRTNRTCTAPTPTDSAALICPSHPVLHRVVANPPPVRFTAAASQVCIVAWPDEHPPTGGVSTMPHPMRTEGPPPGVLHRAPSWWVGTTTAEALHETASPSRTASTGGGASPCPTLFGLIISVRWMERGPGVERRTVRGSIARDVNVAARSCRTTRRGPPDPRPRTCSNASFTNTTVTGHVR